MGQTSRISTFEHETGRCLPGFLYCFNIADFKRRNVHLGYQTGDKDIQDLDALLKGLASESVVVQRTDGQRWFMVSRQNENARVQDLLDRYKRTEHFSAGWQITAARGGVKKSDRRAIATEISRAVRCIYTEVTSPDELGAAMSAIKDNDYDRPVNRPLLLRDIAALPRQRWRCVAAYPAENPACPFCQGRDFAWEDGDDSIYTGDGACRACGATISIHDISDLVSN